MKKTFISIVFALFIVSLITGIIGLILSKNRPYGIREKEYYTLKTTNNTFKEKIDKLFNDTYNKINDKDMSLSINRYEQIKIYAEDFVSYATNRGHIFTLDEAMKIIEYRINDSETPNQETLNKYNTFLEAMSNNENYIHDEIKAKEYRRYLEFKMIFESKDASEIVELMNKEFKELCSSNKIKFKEEESNELFKREMLNYIKTNDALSVKSLV